MFHFPSHPDEVKDVFYEIRKHIKEVGTRGAPGRGGAQHQYANMSYYELMSAGGTYVPHYEYFTPEKVAELKKGADEVADG